MAELEPDSPEWHIQHLENERVYWETLLKSLTPEDSHHRRHYLQLKLQQMDYRIDQHRQTLRERESEGIRKWLTK